MASHPIPVAAPGMTIGLLGGSFNPAHAGHMHISDQALRHLQLDRVWWLVSPQNPLKGTTETAPFADRLARARALMADPRIQITDLEQRMRTRFSIDTITRMKQRWPGVGFVWLMGADIFGQLPQWKQWQQFINQVPIAVFDRPGYSHKALRSQPAFALQSRRLDASRSSLLAWTQPPAWSFIHIPRHDLSSSALRRLQRI